MYKAIEKTPLMEAAARGDLEAVKQYREQLGATDSVGQTALMYAAANGKDDCTTLLISEASHQTTEKGHTALIIAVLNLHVPPRALIQAEGHISDFSGRDTVSHAISRGNYCAAAVIEGVVKKNPKLTPLMCAARVGDTHSTKKLLNEYACQVDTWGRTALIHAAMENAASGNECVELLAEKEAGVQDVHGRTALIYAAMNCNVVAVHTLLDKAAKEEVGAIDREQKCALSYALENASYDCIVALAKPEYYVLPSAFHALQAMRDDTMFRALLEGVNLQVLGEQYLKQESAKPEPCLYCGKNLAVMKTLPCEHLCLCVSCCRDFRNTNCSVCPVCNSAFTEWAFIVKDQAAAK